MGFLRRRRQRRDDSAAPEVATPSGMAWVREEEVDDWAVQLALEAVNRMGDELPEYLMDSADIALEAVRGLELAQQFHDETHRLAYKPRVRRLLGARDSHAGIGSARGVGPAHRRSAAAAQ